MMVLPGVVVEVLLQLNALIIPQLCPFITINTECSFLSPPPSLRFY